MNLKRLRMRIARGLVLGVATMLATSIAVAETPIAAEDCNDMLDVRQAAWRVLDRDLPVAVPAARSRTAAFSRIVSRRITPAAARGSDLVIMSFMGGASRGKSTLVNWFPLLATGKEFSGRAPIYSPVGPRSGMTRRLLLLVPRGTGKMHEQRLADLHSRLPGVAQLTDPEELLDPGPPLYVEVDGLESTPNVVVMDSPDLNSGDLLKDDSPVNIEAAREALLATDVVSVVTDDIDLRDLGLARSIAENFETFGFLDSIFMLRTDASGEKQHSESKQWLIEFIRQMHGLNGPGPAPTPVRGVFAVEKSQSVALGERPIIIDTGDGTYPAFVNGLASDSASIRRRGERAAARAVAKPVMREFAAFADIYATIASYEAVLQGMLELAPAPVAFPYDQNSPEWRRRFKKQAPPLSRINDGAADVAASVGRAIHADVVRRVRDETVTEPPTFAEIAALTQDQVQDRWSGHLNEMLRELAMNRITLPRAVADRVLERLNTDGHAPIPIVRPRVESTGDRVTIHLPDLAQLGPRGEALKKVLATSGRELIDKMQSSDPYGWRMLANDRVNHGLGHIFRNDYPSRQKLRDFVMNVYTNVAGFGLPGSGLANVAGGLIWSTGSMPLILGLTTAGLGVTAATYVRARFARETDTRLTPLLEAWFRDQQREVFTRGLAHILSPVLAQLNPRDLDQQSAAFKRVREALDTLGGFEPEIH